MLKRIQYYSTTKNNRGLCAIEAQVYYVPPSVWDKNSFSRFLCEFVACEILEGTLIANFSCFLFDARQNSQKVMNGFVIFSVGHKVLALGNLLWDMWWEEHPSFPTNNQGIPRRRGQGINVNGCTRAFWAYEEPTVRRAALFRYQAKEIVTEVQGNLVVGCER